MVSEGILLPPLTSILYILSFHQLRRDLVIRLFITGKNTEKAMRLKHIFYLLTLNVDVSIQSYGLSNPSPSFTSCD